MTKFHKLLVVKEFGARRSDPLGAPRIWMDINACSWKDCTRHVVLLCSFMFSCRYQMQLLLVVAMGVCSLMLGLRPRQ